MARPRPRRSRGDIQRLVLASHAGTHVDAPLPCVKGGRTEIRGGDGAPARIFALEEP